MCNGEVEGGKLRVTLGIRSQPVTVISPPLKPPVNPTGGDGEKDTETFLHVNTTFILLTLTNQGEYGPSDCHI